MSDNKCDFDENELTFTPRSPLGPDAPDAPLLPYKVTFLSVLRSMVTVVILFPQRCSRLGSNDKCNLRDKIMLTLSRANMSKYGLRNSTVYGPKIWNSLQDNLRINRDR